MKEGVKVWCAEGASGIFDGVVVAREGEYAKLQLPNGFHLLRRANQLFATHHAAKVAWAAWSQADCKATVAYWERQAAVPIRRVALAKKHLAKAEARLAALKARVGK